MLSRSSRSPVFAAVVSFALLIFSCSGLVSTTYAQDVQGDEAIHEILDAFHDAIEGHTEEQGGLEESSSEHHFNLRRFVTSLGNGEALREWIGKFNFKRMMINTYRVFQIKKADPRYREHALNLAFMFPLSHSLEMLSGPAALMLGESLGMGDGLRYGIGTVGVIISIPGLDPLCIILYSAYATKPFRKMVTALRTRTFSAVAFAGKASGVQFLMSEFSKRAIDRQSPMQALDALAESFALDEFELRMEQPSDTRRVLTLRSGAPDGEATIARLEFETRAYEHDPTSDSTYLKSLEIGEIGQAASTREGKRAYLKLASELHWNVRDVMKQALKAKEKSSLEEYAQQFFVRSLLQEPSHMRLEFEDRSVPLPSHSRFKPVHLLSEKFSSLSGSAASYCARLLER